MVLLLARYSVFELPGNYLVRNRSQSTARVPAIHGIVRQAVSDMYVRRCFFTCKSIGIITITHTPTVWWGSTVCVCVWRWFVAWWSFVQGHGEWDVLAIPLPIFTFARTLIVVQTLTVTHTSLAEQHHHSLITHHFPTHSLTHSYTILTISRYIYIVGRQAIFPLTMTFM